MNPDTVVLYCILQMSKSTGNFLTLTEAVAKFSADGEFDLLYLTLLMACISI